MRVKHHRSNALSVCVLISFFTFLLVAGAAPKIKCPIQSLYQFGDSISDTGNIIRLIRGTIASCWPYGETFPGYPTGRSSNGRLIIDYIAMALGLPLLNPYLARTTSLKHGVNFAVAGSTALYSSFFLAKGIRVLPVPSLIVQLGWFRTYLNSTCSTPTDCGDELSKSLVFVGEIGYNDIRFAISQRRPLQEIYDYIPLVVQAIINTTREVIEAGASQVVVPGIFPLGCFPFALSALPSDDPTSYGDLGCLKSVNNLTAFMNNEIQEALDSLRNEYPDIFILYADYYNAFESILHNASALGFDTRNLLKQCCGVEGKYDPSDPEFCGNPSVPVCPNPNSYIQWDGIHLTQAAYYHISEIIIKDLNINCSSVNPDYQVETLVWDI